MLRVSVSFALSPHFLVHLCAHLTATLTRIHLTDLLPPRHKKWTVRHPQELDSTHSFCGRPYYTLLFNDLQVAHFLYYS